MAFWDYFVVGLLVTAIVFIVTLKLVVYFQNWIFF